MAAITPNTILRESMGSATLLICGLTTTTSNDTWTPSEVLPVIGNAYWIQAVGGLGINEPDTYYNPTTGVFTFVGGTTSGPMVLYIMVRT